MSQNDDAPPGLRWARLRFSIIGPLLHSPPEKGELGARIARLASTPWRHLCAGRLDDGVGRRHGDGHLSPPGSTGPTFSGIAGTQGPTR